MLRLLSYDPTRLGTLLAVALGRTLLDGNRPLADHLLQRLQPHDDVMFFRELFLFALLPLTWLSVSKHRLMQNVLGSRYTEPLFKP